MFRKEKYMGIEALGSIGTAMGSVASGIGRGAASLGRVSGEMPSLGAASISKLDSMFGPKIGSIIPEGINLMGAKNFGTIDLIGGVSQPFNPVGEILFQAKPELNEAASAVAEAESIISQAPFLSLRNHEVAKQSGLEIAALPLVARNDELVEPMIAIPLVTPLTVSLKVPDVLEFPKPQIVASPVLEPQTATATKTENRVSAAPSPTILPQPVPAEQEVEEVVEEKIEKEEPKEILEEEETEELTLKDVVDEEVLNRRLEEFGSAAETAGAWLEEENLQEIDPDLIGVDGSEIVKRIPVETAVSRSGIVKKQGPDGSREETIEEVASRRFRSIKEAKERIAAIIAQKVPVKRAKEGKAAGYEAVARVLKYFFVKARPAEQLVTRVVKKQRPVPVASVAKPEVKETRIEDLGLSDLLSFPISAVCVPA